MAEELRPTRLDARDARCGRFLGDGEQGQRDGPAGGVPAEVEHLVAVLPEGWAVTTETPDGSARGRCIESTRLALAVLAELGVGCRPMACEVMVFNQAAWERYQARTPKADWPAGCWSVGVAVEGGETGGSLTEPYRRPGWAGHLVVHGGHWFADFTAEQFHRPAHGITMTGAVVAPVDPEAVGVQAEMETGGTVATWWWRPEVRGYRTTPAWRQDIPRTTVVGLAGLVRRRMAGEPVDLIVLPG